jgi:hypothetical protein
MAFRRHLIQTQYSLSWHSGGEVKASIMTIVTPASTQGEEAQSSRFAFFFFGPSSSPPFDFLAGAAISTSPSESSSSEDEVADPPSDSDAWKSSSSVDR